MVDFANYDVANNFSAAPRSAHLENDSNPACPGKERPVRLATISRLVLAAVPAIAALLSLIIDTPSF